MEDVPVTAAATFCATLVDEWIRCGITDAVVAPGSRSTPLALALAADDRLRIHIHHDERSAAFLALGLATATGRPAPVLTTSGTAAAELHAAVVEAHHGRVPMICCTADRPPELHGVGAPQTIDQTKLYGDSVRWFADPGVPDEAASGSWRSLAARAVAEATGSPAGPVHLNLPFRDPLVGRPADLPGRAGSAPWHRRPAARTTLDDTVIHELAGRLAGACGVVVAGGTGGGRALDAASVHDLARALGWPVLADPRSGCRTVEGTAVAHGDLLLRSPRFVAGHRPDLLLQLGEPPASKVQAQWLRDLACPVIAVDPDGVWHDPDRVVSELFPVDPGPLCRALAGRVGQLGAAIPGEWLEGWADADARAATAVAATLALHPEPTEPAIARDVAAAVPEGGSLVVSSSMPVRDLEWFSPGRRGVRVVANRGANGIDGVVSTAVGVALTGAPTALLIGDVAYLHDTNGLLGLGKRAVSLAIVVVDNDGGGIFSFLPQATTLPQDRFERLFGTPHGVDLVALAAAHGIEAVHVDSQGQVGPTVAAALSGGGVRVIVATTDRTANVAVHEELNAAVAAALA